MTRELTVLDFLLRGERGACDRRFEFGVAGGASDGEDDEEEGDDERGEPLLGETRG